MLREYMLAYLSVVMWVTMRYSKVSIRILIMLMFPWQEGVLRDLENRSFNETKLSRIIPSAM